MTAVDPLSLQIFANLFAVVAEEMGVTLQQASFSPNIKARLDFSCALFDTEGRLLAQAAHIPVHLGAMPQAMRTVRRTFDLRPGDVVIMNDPYAGGTHLPDISLVSGAFDQAGRHLGYVMSRAHHSDVGGMSPGSMPLSTEIYQEGMIIPPLLLLEEGRVNEGLLSLLLRNVRTPAERRGDLDAQIAAQTTGERGLRHLAERYGPAAVAVHGEALQAYSEEAMRSLIRHIPPGVHRFEDVLDSDGIGPDPVPIRVALEPHADGGLTIDFTGTAPQVLGPLNAVEAVTVSATLYVLRCLLIDDVPVNEGSLRPLRIICPEGSLVAARSPAAVAGGNVETSQRVTDVVFGALARALPERVPAASQGTMNNLTLGGMDPIRGRAFAYYETMGGGMGARPGQDGLSAVHDHMSNTLNTPVEVLESEYPVRVRRYALRHGSGGAGAARGGEGLVREIEALCPMAVTVLSERRRFPPYGLRGGPAGERGENTASIGGERRALAGKCSLTLQAGDTVCLATPGGGGWGRLPHSS